MPDPRLLRVNDRVRFVGLPEEWAEPGHRVHDESLELMNALIARGRPARVGRIGDDGFPWIDVRIRRRDGTVAHHSWGIYETTGWVRVRRRGP